MPAEVKILIEGCTNADSVSVAGEEKTVPTVSLVRDGDITMVVDPGVLESQQDLINALARENLTVDDINIVAITHSHIDHYRNIGMFPSAKTLEYYGLWDKGGVENWLEHFSENIQVLHTPGHDYTGLTFLVQTQKGIVAICGDVFWKKNYPVNSDDDVFASNPDRLGESRMTILRRADWIIPGHGPMYKNDKLIVPVKEEGPTKPKTTGTELTVACKKCGRQMKQKDKCQCRPYLCFNCCECGLDCDSCSCSHKLV